MTTSFYTSGGVFRTGIKYAPIGSGPPPEGILAALAQPNPTLGGSPGSEGIVGAGYLSGARRCYVQRTGITFYVDAAKVPVTRAVFRAMVYGPTSGTAHPTWQLWWATSPYHVPDGNTWYAPLLVPASLPIGPKAYGVNEPVQVELINFEDNLVPHDDNLYGWNEHCCLGITMVGEEDAEPTGTRDWVLTFAGGGSVDIYYGGGNTRIVVPLVPGPVQARGGNPGSGHRTRR